MEMPEKKNILLRIYSDLEDLYVAVDNRTRYFV